MKALFRRFLTWWRGPQPMAVRRESSKQKRLRVQRAERRYKAWAERQRQLAPMAREVSRREARRASKRAARQRGDA